MTNLELTETDLPQIEHAFGSNKRGEVRPRATAIRLLHLGKDPKEVAEALAASLPTVTNWRAGWRADGLEGLAHCPKGGRPRIADERYCQVLEETLEKEPAGLGYEFGISPGDSLSAGTDGFGGGQRGQTSLQSRLLSTIIAVRLPWRRSVCSNSGSCWFSYRLMALTSS